MFYAWKTLKYFMIMQITSYKFLRPESNAIMYKT